MELLLLLASVLFWCGLWGVVCMLIGQRKNRTGGFWWGFFLGLIGVIVVVAQTPGLPPAPHGLMAVKCPRCNAVQNVTQGKPYECWQCHAKTAAPAVAPTRKKLTVSCPDCRARLTVPASSTLAQFKCPECGARGQMPLRA